MTLTEFEGLLIEATSLKDVKARGRRIREVSVAERSDAGVFLNCALLLWEIMDMVQEIFQLEWEIRVKREWEREGRRFVTMAELQKELKARVRPDQ